MTTPGATRRSFLLIADVSVIGLLSVEFLLWLSERFQWLPRGYAVLICVATVAVAMLSIFLWFALSLILRWPFQFSIRSLLMLVIALVIPCSWMLMERQRANKQREVVDEIKKRGGLVDYDYEFDSSDEYMPGGKPSWLRDLFGPDFLSHVRSVSIDPQDDDAWLAHLKDLHRLAELCLNATDVTDAELELLKDFTQLQRLYLYDTHITDAGLVHLKGLTLLHELNLCNTQITDVGLKHLKVLTQLQQLDIRLTGVTNEGVEELQQALPKCKIEHFTSPDPTDGANLKERDAKLTTSLRALVPNLVQIAGIGPQPVHAQIVVLGQAGD